MEPYQGVLGFNASEPTRSGNACALDAEALVDSECVI